MTLGEIVKNYREKNNLSMDIFAKKTNLSKGYISMLEKNKNPQNGKPIAPSLETIKTVANAINMDIKDLLKMLDDNQEVILDNTDPFQSESENLNTEPTPVLVAAYGGGAADIEERTKIMLKKKKGLCELINESKLDIRQLEELEAIVKALDKI